MPIPTNTATPVEIAAKLRKDARDITFTDLYGDTSLTDVFGSIIQQTAGALEFMNNSEVAADTDLLMEFAYEIAHQFWRIAERDSSLALEPIDTWFDDWFHLGYRADDD